MGLHAGQAVSHITAAFDVPNITGYESLVASIIKDAKDRHVLAAAVCRGTRTPMPLPVALARPKLRRHDAGGMYPRPVVIFAIALPRPSSSGSEREFVELPNWRALGLAAAPATEASAWSLAGWSG